MSVEEVSPLKPGLVVGLAMHIGTKKNQAIQILKDELQTYGYDTIVVKPTSIIEEARLQSLVPPSKRKTQKADLSDFEDRYHQLIDICNALSERVTPDFLARIAVRQIMAKRDQYEAGGGKRPVAFIIDQLKRPKEVEHLRGVYGERFVLLSLQAPIRERENTLARDIAKSLSQNVTQRDHASALLLMSRDREEMENDHGQRAELVFSQGDVIVNISKKQKIEYTIDHFLRAFFGDNVSPTMDEYGMFAAWSAAYRSSDMSRQVGAAIFTSKMEVLALGCNEVPKPGGGTYFRDAEGDLSGTPDYEIGVDRNAELKDTLGRNAISEVVGKLLPDMIIKDSDIRKVLSSETLLLNDITEFGRAVHAEMNAITDAARCGTSLRGATLYCTTFPCHNCAKHIVASGIKRVVYIQPYPKSQAGDLYPDSIEIDPKSPNHDLVTFTPHVGIAPSIYVKTYKRGRSKGPDGRATEFERQKAQPPVPTSDIGFGQNEKASAAELLLYANQMPKGNKKYKDAIKSCLKAIQAQIG